MFAIRGNLLCCVFVAGTTMFAYDIYLGERPSTEPYISGDTFRKYCDHAFDIKHRTINPEEVEPGAIIFVTTDDGCLQEFITNYHPQIKVPYLLVTHNGDMNITDQFESFLESENLYVWFAQNVAYVHPKLKNLPIGLENQLWKRDYAGLISSFRNQGFDKGPRPYLVNLNISVTTNPSERTVAYNYFSKQSFCYCPPKKNVRDYLMDVCNAKFIVSPHGNGLDCHRTWEALYLGAIPIVKRSTLDPLYEDLPVLIVDTWQEVTQSFLEQKYEEMRNKSYRWEKLHIDYWLNVFAQYKKACDEQYSQRGSK